MLDMYMLAMCWTPGQAYHDICNS